MVELYGNGKSAVISGGGPVGALSAIYLSRRGFKVDLYESRDDIRKETENRRSINLALSTRGIESLKAVGLDTSILNIGTKCFARKIHKPTITGDCYEVPYGTEPHHYLLSIDRLKLNQALLDLADKCENVTLNFNHKSTGMDFKKSEITFNKTGGETMTRDYDILLGCDGLYSAVRRQMQRVAPVTFSHTYINCRYKELLMPIGKDGKPPMDVNCLHIWPRGSYMMMGLANLDGSFTMTLFMPGEIFDGLKTGEDVVAFFKNHFPDSLALFQGEQNLIDNYFGHKDIELSYIKTDPYSYGDNVFILGDAAHAIVPFYGQGLNAGMEDIMIFDKIFDQNSGHIPSTVQQFSDNRKEHGQAIADLAVFNFWVMRDGVNSKWFLWKRWLSSHISRVCPSVVTPLYVLVSFTLTPYADAWKRHLRNEQIVSSLLIGGAALSTTALAFGALKYGNKETFTTLKTVATDIVSRLLPSASLSGSTEL